MKNLIDTVASQYANSPTLMQLIASMNQYFDPSTDFEAFYDYLWNVDTAQGFGLDVWGKIVNVSRELTIPGTAVYFGFDVPEVDGADSSLESVGFDQAPFYTGDAVTQTYTLSDDAYRTLILTKALANISASTAPSLNQLLRNLFANRGKCYVIDGPSMTMTFVFEFILTPYEMAVLTQSGAIPTPAGVLATIRQIDFAGTFGFRQSVGVQTFGQGAFYHKT